MALPFSDHVPHASDGVWLEDIKVWGVVGPDAWHRSGRPQPIEIKAKVPISVDEAGMLDDVNQTVHYGTLAKSIMEIFKDQDVTFASLEELVVAIANKALLQGVEARLLELMIILPEAILLADGLGVVCNVSRIDPPPGLDEETKLKGTELKLVVKDLRLNCIIGVNPHERVEKQPVVVNLEFWKFDKPLLIEYADTIKKISEVRLRLVHSALLMSISKLLRYPCPILYG